MIAASLEEDPFEHDDELVAAEPAEEVAGPDRLGQPAGDLGQRLVAGALAQPVVHALEVVDVEQHDRPAPLVRGLQVSEQAGPVGQVGQRVVEGLVLEGRRTCPPSEPPWR